MDFPEIISAFSFFWIWDEEENSWSQHILKVGAGYLYFLIFIFSIYGINCKSNINIWKSCFRCVVINIFGTPTQSDLQMWWWENPEILGKVFLCSWINIWFITFFYPREDLQGLKNLGRLSFNLWPDHDVRRVLSNMMEPFPASFEGFPFVGDFGDIGLPALSYY